MAATTASYSITMRMHTGDRPGDRRGRGHGHRRDRRHRDRDRRRRLQPRPARRRRHLLGQRRRALERGRGGVETSSGRARPQGHRPRSSCCTSAARSRSSPRSRCATATTSSMAYTPGVGRVSQALAEHPEDVRRLTIKGNTVAVVTDGSAVLGLGNIGPVAALPVMEGKAALFKRFADIDAWPICIDTTGRRRDRAHRRAHRPGLRRHQPRGHRRAALLRGRAPAARAPRHPGLPRRPARHGDRRARGAEERAARGRQEAARRPDRRLRRWRGRHGDRHRCCWPRAPSTSSSSTAPACSPPTTTPHPGEARARRGAPTRAASPATCRDGLAGADVFIGVSAPRILKAEWIKRDGRRRRRLRARQPRPRGRPLRGDAVRHGRGHRPLRLPEPDQQRARVPRRLPRPARRPGAPR